MTMKQLSAFLAALVRQHGAGMTVHQLAVQQYDHVIGCLTVIAREQTTNHRSA